MKPLFHALIIASAFAASAVPAQTFDFSYITSNGVLNGTAVGTLQSDNNSVVVTSLVADFTPTGGVAAGVPLLPLGGRVLVGGGGIPTLSLNGLNNSISACTTLACSDGFIIVPANVLGPIPLYNGGPSYGFSFQPFNAANWSMQQVSTGAIPEPSSWMMLIAGFGLVGAVLRRRAVAAA